MSPAFVAVRLAASSALAGLAAGLVSAAFLFLLDAATAIRLVHEGLVVALPLGGWVLGALYERFGGRALGGTNLVIDTIASGGPQLPRRMGPLVLFGTVATHLFGGSGGREGTAVQVGASLADELAQRLALSGEARRALLLAGVAAGFGAVFGTPWAGLVFALELPETGRLQWRAAVPAALAAHLGDAVARACGAAHTVLPAVGAVEVSGALLARWLVFAVAIALTAVLFVEATHGARRLGAKYVPSLAWRMGLGGLVLVALWQLQGTGDFLGLSLPVLNQAFGGAPLTLATPAWKLAFTVVTLGAGYLGGEVTPLFVIGASLGHVLAAALGLPTSLGAAVGMAALFGSAAKTPLALAVMAAEVVGLPVLPHALVVAVVASLLTRRWRLYTAQR